MIERIYVGRDGWDDDARTIPCYGACTYDYPRGNAAFGTTPEEAAQKLLDILCDAKNIPRRTQKKGENWEYW